jgi:hypothetical protein
VSLLSGAHLTDAGNDVQQLIARVAVHAGAGAGRELHDGGVEVAAVTIHEQRAPDYLPFKMAAPVRSTALPSVDQMTFRFPPTFSCQKTAPARP